MRDLGVPYRVTAGEAIQSAVLVLCSEHGIDEVVNAILVQSRAMLGAREVYMLLREGDRLVLRASDGLPEGIGPVSLCSEEGIEGWAATRGRVVVIPDARRDAHFEDLVKGGRPVGGMVAVPMWLRGEVVGVVAARREAKGLYTEADYWWLQILGGLAAVAIENDRAYRSQERRARQAEMLLEISAIPDDDPTSFLKRLGTTISRTLEVDTADVMLSSNDGSALISLGMSDRKLAMGERAHGLGRLSLSGGGPIVEVFETGQPYLCRDVEVDPVAAQSHRGLGYRSLVAAPVVVEGKRRGVLYLASLQPSAFDSEDVAYLLLVATRVGLLIEQVELRRRRAEIDRKQTQAQAREEFLGMASHELKTPVAVIKAYTELLLRRAAKAHNETDADVLRRIGEQAERMLYLIDQLLDLRRIESGSLPLELSRFDLVDLASRALEGLQLTAPTHRLVLTANEPVVVLADRRRIEQVLSNLLENAIRYSPSHSLIEINIRREEHPDHPAEERVLVAVSDEGTGIAEDERDRIFERFYQGQARLHRGHVGLGLGLYISRELVRRHGGTMWLESTPGKGSTFYFSLPVEGLVDSAFDTTLATDT